VPRAYVLENDHVTMHGTIAELANNKQVQTAQLCSRDQFVSSTVRF
jgi:ABC-type lipopolysaccharide export system ATPase subunit